VAQSTVKILNDTLTFL